MAETVEVVLVMGPDGQMQAAIPSGTTFERAAPALKKLFTQLGLDGLPVVMLGEPEQHNHGPEQERVSFGTRQHSH